MNKYQIKLTRVWDTYAEVEALTMEDAMTMYDSMVQRGEMAQKELEQMGISDESYKITLLEPVSEPTQSVLGAWRDDGQVEGQYYARQCDITGEGMYEGWVVDGGLMYIKYESDAIEYCKNELDMTLQEAYDDSEENGGDGFYHTSWEDDESDYQYRLVDGVLVDEDDERFQYRLDKSEPTLEPDYFSPTEETMHRMSMVLDDLAKIREWAVQQKAPEEVLVMFSNIEIACDLDDKECLMWDFYKD